MKLTKSILALFALTLLAPFTVGVAAQEKEPTKITLAEGKIQFTVPAGWEVKKPASNIVEHEFAAPGPDDKLAAARVTMMGAGGSVAANIDRWKGQFTETDDKAMKTEETKIAGQVVHLVDFSGSYNDRPGPFVPGVVRENYRMLAAIVVTDKLGQYFIKAYGPKETIAANEKAFHEMIKSLEVK